MATDENDAEVEDLSEDEIAQIEAIAAETARGDIRDFMLDRIKRMKKPWDQLDEFAQKSEIISADMAASELIRKVVMLVAAHGRRHVRAAFEQYTVKDGLKIVLQAPVTQENVLMLTAGRGSQVILTLADDSPFAGQKTDPKPEPNQGTLPVDPPAEGADDKPVFDGTKAGEQQAQEKPADKPKGGRKPKAGDADPETGEIA